MKFNYEKEWNIFLKKWEKQKALMIDEGLSQEAIMTIYEFDLNEFKANRNYCLHNEEFVNFDDDTQLINSKTRKHGMVEIPNDFDECVGFLQSVANEKLYTAMSSLKEKDLQLFSLYALEGYTVTELAVIRGQTHQNISKKIKQIKNILKKVAD